MRTRRRLWGVASYVLTVMTIAASIGAALAEGGPLDPLRTVDVAAWLAHPAAPSARIERLTITSPDPDDLTLRAARLLAQADLICHDGRVPAAILNRGRADAARCLGPAPADAPGLTLALEMAS